MPPLKEVVEESDTRWGRAFDLLIQSLIVLSLISFSFETLPTLSESSQLWLRRFEVFSVIVFSIEYLLRVYVATPRRSYIFSFFGIIDILAILPFYIMRGVDLRSIRVFRLLRLFRIFKLARYSAAVRRFHLALHNPSVHTDGSLGPRHRCISALALHPHHGRQATLFLSSTAPTTRRSPQQTRRRTPSKSPSTMGAVRHAG